jgi:hypothetical protein
MRIACTVEHALDTLLGRGGCHVLQRAGCHAENNKA